MAEERHPFSGRKVLISTPVFGGKVEIQYLASVMAMIPFLIQNNIHFEIMCEARNLIHQARNRAAEHALRNGFDKLLFIDSDITFKGNDILLLLASEKRVVGGLYPLKNFPIKLNFTPKQGVYNGAESFNLHDYIKDFSDPKTGEVEVFMLPTGFMCIDVNIFRDLDPFVDQYHHRDPLLGKTEYEKMYFPFKIADDGFLYTEDWSFCDLVRNKLKETIYWNTKVIVDHVGMHTYSATTPLEKAYKHLDTNVGQILTSDQVLGKTPPKTEHAPAKPNPFKKWPRNLQCFCGSGRKFKKCCELGLSSDVTSEEALILQPDFDRMLKEVQTKTDQGIGYKLKETVYDQVKTET